MATSGIYTRTVTAADVIKSAMRKLGVLDAGGTPTSDEYTDGLEALNDLIEQWKGPSNRYLPSAKMWTLETASFSLSTDSANYTIYSNTAADCNIEIPEEIRFVSLKNTTTNDEEELRPYLSSEYQALSNKENSGTPTRYYWEKKLTTSTMYLNVIPSATIADGYEVWLQYRQPIELCTATGNEIDMPDHWRRALKWNLALEIAPEYEYSTPPPMVIQNARDSLAYAQTFEPQKIHDFFEPEKD